MLSKPSSYVIEHCISFTISLTSSWTAFSLFPTISLSVSLSSHYCATWTAHSQEPRGSSSSAAVGWGIWGEKWEIPTACPGLLFASSLSWLMPLHNSIYLCPLSFPICKITTECLGDKGTEMKTNYYYGLFLTNAQGLKPLNSSNSFFSPI